MLPKHQQHLEEQQAASSRLAATAHATDVLCCFSLAAAVPDAVGLSILVCQYTCFEGWSCTNIASMLYAIVLKAAACHILHCQAPAAWQRGSCSLAGLVLCGQDTPMAGPTISKLWGVCSVVQEWLNRALPGALGASACCIVLLLHAGAVGPAGRVREAWQGVRGEDSTACRSQNITAGVRNQQLRQGK